MKSSLRIRISYLQAFLLSFATVLDAAYVKEVFPPYYVVQNVIFIAAAFLFVLQIRSRKMMLSYSFLLMIAYCAHLGFATVLNHASTYNFVNRMYIIVAFMLLIYLIKNDQELVSILKIWRGVLLAMLLIDVLTMALFPNGLYRSIHEYESYTNCWFLGYKTNRLLYSLPLLFFDSYLVLKQNHKIHVLQFLLYALVVVDTFYSSATMGAVVIVIYLIGYLSLYSMKPERLSKNILYKSMMNYRLYGIAYAAVFVTVVVFQSNRFLQSIAANYFSKGMDFNNRFPIWRRSLEAIAKKPLIGYGMLNSSDYLRITKIAVNPHNMLLTILLTGGIIGLVLMVLYYLVSMRRAEQNRQNAMLIFGIYLVLLLGITSSTLVYSPYIFAAISIITLRQPKKG